MFNVAVFCPKDNFEDATIPIEFWLSDEDGDFFRANLYFRATQAVRLHRFWDGHLRSSPRVAYNPVSDREYFIFKLDQGGTTFFVGEDQPSLALFDPHNMHEAIEVDL